MNTPAAKRGENVMYKYLCSIEMEEKRRPSMNYMEILQKDIITVPIFSPYQKDQASIIGDLIHGQQPCKNTEYKPVALKECVRALHDLHVSKRGASFEAIRKKYKKHEFQCVANLSSPPHLPSYLFEEIQ